MIENTLQPFYDLLDKYSKEYGDNSNACLIVRLSLLTYLLKHHIALCNINSLANRIVEQYNFERPEPREVKFEIVLDNNRESYHIQEERNEIIDLDFEFDDELITLNKNNISKLKDSKWYLFCFTPEEELIIFDYSWSTTELISERNKPLVKNHSLIHPMLVSHNNYNVVSAGEICVVHEKNVLKGIVINNKSGHFRPNSTSLDYVKEFLIRELNIDSKLIIKLNLY
ncbi:hypothetical protein [Streptococcus sanguinis]|uniref:Uncharacterized protein n=1 Tax=Streptococcus sanguinis TaxID=1305 RepID=A0A3R9GPM8_STRSA|nr:hypothetical protein [Streptococcus sanguinis]RSI10594.1 hypothetical protein D8887_06305 [Streptococcus sanguinis]